jgi:hypothetical protein
MNKIEEEIELKDVRESAQDFSNELGGVANKMDPLALSKMSSGEQLENIADAIDKTEKNDSEDHPEKEISSIKLDPRELSPEDFSTSGISTVEAKEKASSESSVAEKT